MVLLLFLRIGTLLRCTSHRAPKITHKPWAKRSEDVSSTVEALLATLEEGILDLMYWRERAPPRDQGSQWCRCTRTPWTREATSKEAGC